MTQPTTCCCHSPDPHECFIMRYPRAFPFEDEDDDVANDDNSQCECGCHLWDEDGRNGWGVQLEEFEL